jgi:putative hydrolase of the HAD superfamily
VFCLSVRPVCQAEVCGRRTRTGLGAWRRPGSSADRRIRGRPCSVCGRCLAPEGTIRGAPSWHAALVRGGIEGSVAAPVAALSTSLQMSYASRTVNSVRSLIIFDGDDTLWQVEHLYDDARQRAAAIAGEVGIDSTYWTRVQKEIDLANVATWGLSRFRFPISSVLAYERIASELGLDIDEAVRARIVQASAGVFTAAASLMPGALDALCELSHSRTLALLTQGDRIVQEKRLADSGLAASFDMIRVVDLKDEGSFSELLADAGVAPRDAWSVGNSLPSDINPALRLGMRAIWIDAHVWAHERRQSAPAAGTVFTCSSLTDVPAVIASHSASGA